MNRPYPPVDHDPGNGRSLRSRVRKAEQVYVPIDLEGRRDIGASADILEGISYTPVRICAALKKRGSQE